MAFLTGSGKIPALGLPPKITVTFKHDFRKRCKCVPIVSTCSLTLAIPAYIHDEETMLEVFERAFRICQKMRKIFCTSFVFDLYFTRLNN